MRALKIVGFVALVLWMAWITIRLKWTYQVAQLACGYAFSEKLSHGSDGVRIWPNPYLCPSGGVDKEFASKLPMPSN